MDQLASEIADLIHANPDSEIVAELLIDAVAAASLDTGQSPAESDRLFSEIARISQTMATSA